MCARISHFEIDFLLLCCVERAAQFVGTKEESGYYHPVFFNIGSLFISHYFMIGTVKTLC
jgi:hypothetical protein